MEVRLRESKDPRDLVPQYRRWGPGSASTRGPRRSPGTLSGVGRTSSRDFPAGRRPGSSRTQGIRRPRRDWSRTTAAERRRLVARRWPPRAAPRRPCLRGSRRQEVVAANRTAVSRGWRSAPVQRRRRRVVAHVATSEGSFVCDAYGRCIASGGEARRIVAGGLQGRPSARRLAEAQEQVARAALVDSAPSTWRWSPSGSLRRAAPTPR